MTLTLTIRNPVAGTPPPLTIDRRDIAIGRATGVDWMLPDPQVSSRHCEIGFRDGTYLLRDTSTNGTSVNGTKLAGLHRLADRDVIGIGGCEVLVNIGPAPAPATGAAPDAWQRASAAPSAPTPTPAAPAPVTMSRSVAGTPIEAALAAALATLLETRKRQLGELGATVPDALARNPLAEGAAGAHARLAALPPATAAAAIQDATAAIERHHAASLRAMQAALRAALAELDPTAIESRAAEAKTLAGDARDATLWRAYRQRFDGEKLAGKGFVETFARAFREAYDKLAG